MVIRLKIMPKKILGRGPHTIRAIDEVKKSSNSSNQPLRRPEAPPSKRLQHTNRSSSTRVYLRSFTQQPRAAIARFVAMHATRSARRLGRWDPASPASGTIASISKARTSGQRERSTDWPDCTDFAPGPYSGFGADAGGAERDIRRFGTLTRGHSYITCALTHNVRPCVRYCS